MKKKGRIFRVVCQTDADTFAYNAIHSENSCAISVKGGTIKSAAGQPMTHNNVVNIKSWDISLTALLTQGSLISIISLAMDDNPHNWAVIDDEKARTGLAYITDLTIQAHVNGLAKVSLNIQGTGPLDYEPIDDYGELLLDSNDENLLDYNEIQLLAKY